MQENREEKIELISRIPISQTTRLQKPLAAIFAVPAAHTGGNRTITCVGSFTQTPGGDHDQDVDAD
jgi:hypothetical protein